MKTDLTIKLTLKLTLTLTLSTMLLAATGAPANAAELEGKALYAKNCAACHLADGKGIPGAFPALAGNPFVQGPGAEVSAVLLKGRGGMPNFSNNLGDEEIALVLSYVRSSWGNKGPVLAGAEVAATRDALGVPKATGSRLANKH